MSRQKISKTVNSVLAPFGLKIEKKKALGSGPLQQVHDPALSFMKDDGLKKVLIDELVAVSIMFFEENQLNFEKIDLRVEIDFFYELYSNRGLQNNTGGSGFHNMFWIFLFVRALKPELIVESGVWKGHTSWLLESACPDATVLGFDIDLDNLEYKDGNVEYFEQDWSLFDFGSVDPRKAMVFFDCHVSHARRIIEAKERGFQYLLFDDNPPLHKLYGYGLPGFPTANMLVSKGVLELEEVAWCWQGKELCRKLDRLEAATAITYIKNHKIFPDVGGTTRYGGFSFLTYVEI